ncbi:ABC transporter permease [Chromobacterium sp. IIBBL 290-4]|uniref:ABC transporter permease n=1 Tax=Chromobacterium sp. IIBBL 290-4 TaxID=2953890 RepID=UPI0020B6857D|nr:ABC transporter permease [Chromobacterium sp. IIBBL 290-4]UTH75034.1 ABC transporter permease [Chromobacterium sp. IIBBL 290-4]
MSYFRWDDFRVGWRWLAKEPGWSSLVIGGLAIGFACCFLLLGYVGYSWQFDRHIQGREQVYLLRSKMNFGDQEHAWRPESPMAAGQALRDSGIVEKLSMALGYFAPIRVGNQVVDRWVTLVDPDYADLFEVKTVSGDLMHALTRPDGAAVTEAIALKLYGTTQAVGKTFTVGGKALSVAAVVKTPPPTATQPYEILGGRGSRMTPDSMYGGFYQNWGSLGGYNYFRLKPGHSLAEAVQVLRQALRKTPFYKEVTPNMGAAGHKEPLEFSMVSLADAYLDPDMDSTADPGRHDMQSILWGCVAIGMAILLLAAINYVNLATVRAIRRQREIGVRKVLGASVARVAGQFVAESVLVALLSALIGMGLAWLLLPVFEGMLRRELVGMFSLGNLAMALSGAMLIGLASGAYPAWTAARVRATQSLAGRDQQETPQGIWLRRSLTVLQFAVAMGLASMTLAVAWQTWHGSRLPSGYEVNGLMLSDAGDNNKADAVRRRGLAEAVRRLPGVKMLSYGDTMPAGGSRNTDSYHVPGGRSLDLARRMVDCRFVEAYGLALLAGKRFSTCAAENDAASDESVVLSESAARRLGFTDPARAVGQWLETEVVGSGRAQIVGVVGDAREGTAREQKLALVYLKGSGNVLAIRYQGEEAVLRTAFAQLWPQYFPDYPLNLISAKRQLGRQYERDVRNAQMLAAAAAISLLIAAFGIYVLMAYSVQRMSREVVLRKLYGAGSLAVILRVGRELLWIVLASAGVGLLPAWLFIKHYQADFIERAPIGGWTLLLALALCLLVSALAVWKHMRFALRLRPAEALRG